MEIKLLGRETVDRLVKSAKACKHREEIPSSTTTFCTFSLNEYECQGRYATISPMPEIVRVLFCSTYVHLRFPSVPLSSAFANKGIIVKTNNIINFFISVIVLISNSFINGTKNVSNLLRLRLLRYRQTPNVLKRANAHAERRELSTSVLVHCLENFADFRKTRI